MEIKNTKATLLFFFFILTLSSKGQSGWHELRTFGVNSYSTQAIHALAEDFPYVTVYAGIGSDVFRWKGGSNPWEKLEIPTSTLNANSVINTVATDPSHNVYAAGWFTNANGRCYVAKWDGTFPINNKWSELGGPNGLDASGPIYSVISDSSGNIYAAGSFISGNGSRYVAKWNGTAWSELGSGSNGLNANSTIRSLCADLAGNIYAAGDFTNSAGKYYVAKWDGTKWSEMGSGSGALNANADIKSISTDKQGNVAAVGQFTNSSNEYYVAKWNGSSWSKLPSPPTRINGIIYSGVTDPYGQIYIAGDFTDSAGDRYVAFWNGASWSAIGANKLAANNTIYSITVDDRSRVFAAGEFTNITGHKYVADCASIINTWKETAATGVGALSASGVYTTNYAADLVYGCSTEPNGNGRLNLSKWDGSSWTELGALNSIMPINNLATDKSGNIYAAFAPIYQYQPYIAKWDGQAWSDLGNSTVALNPSTIDKMVADSAGNVYVTGGFVNSNGKNYVARWNGKNWSELGTGDKSLNPDEILSGLKVDKLGNVYVCLYKNFNYHLAKWDGVSWVFLETGPTDFPLGKIETIATDSHGNVYSDFYTGTGYYIRKWDGKKWIKLSIINSTSFVINGNDDLFILSDLEVKRWGGDKWYTIESVAKDGFYARLSLYSDNKNNLYTNGLRPNASSFFIAKYDANHLAIPFVTNVSDKCVQTPSAKGKLQNPLNSGVILIYQDGIPLEYNKADSTFQYFNTGLTSAGTHTIIVKYLQGSDTLTDSVSYKVNPVFVPVVNITTPATDVCANTSFTIKCNVNIAGAAYQWYLDDQPCTQNCNDSSITFSLTTSDVNMYCKVTLPVGQCYFSEAVNSNKILMKLGILAPSVSIASNNSDNIICNNQTVLFTALPVNGGSNLTYQWQKNGVNVNGNSNTYETNSLKNLDEITLILNKVASCITQSAKSNIIKISKDTSTVFLADSVKIICSSTNTAINIGILTKPGYTYYWTSVPAGFTSDNSNPIVLPTTNTIYNVLQTNTATGCTSKDDISVQIDNGCRTVFLPAYPNPANNFVNIDLDNLLSTDEIIFQLLESGGGTTILSQRLTNRKNKIDIHFIIVGLYGYRIIRNGTIIKNDGKLIIVH